ncbi:cobalt transporter CbiM [Anaerovibrio slackiae]|uniref:cobalt transporter CbiM n=1 Tax=Anaerovibrio slackiae TaxID=2652309 RepID=UPI003F152565
MHIPENYLSPGTCAVLTAAMAPVWYMSLQKVKKELPPEKLPLLGVAAAFSFLAMMFNIPLPGGTTGHAVGGTLIAMLFGPYAACLSVSVALIVQAVFFGDGGILAIGANCFNMAFLLPFTGYYAFSLLKKCFTTGTMLPVCAAGAGFMGINAAALAAAIEFGIQPLLFTNELGQALYCPYPLSISIPAMMAGHLTIFGLAEAVFTGTMLAYLTKAAPAFSSAADRYADKKIGASLTALLALIILCPLGLIAEGTAWGEWGPEEMAALTESSAPLGYTPEGMLTGFSLDVLFPDYAISGLPDAFAYILSAIIGTALLVITFKLWGSFATLK